MKIATLLVVLASSLFTGAYANGVGTKSDVRPLIVEGASSSQAPSWLMVAMSAEQREQCMKTLRACIAACDKSYTVGSSSHSGCRVNCNAPLCQ